MMSNYQVRFLGERGKATYTLLPDKTEQTLWLKDIPSQVLRNAAYRWREAYQRHLATNW